LDLSERAFLLVYASPLVNPSGLRVGEDTTRYRCLQRSALRAQLQAIGCKSMNYMLVQKYPVQGKWGIIPYGIETVLPEEDWIVSASTLHELMQLFNESIHFKIGDELFYDIGQSMQIRRLR
jgi:hypothetical protein